MRHALVLLALVAVAGCANPSPTLVASPKIAASPSDLSTAALVSPWANPTSRSDATAASSSQSPSAAPSVPPVRYTNGFPAEIHGERVYRGDEIATRKAEPGSFLVTGTLTAASLDCFVGECPPNSSMWFLSGPSSTSEHSLGVPLLAAGAIWWPVDVPQWAGNLVVLRVRAYDAACPWDQFCASSLLVESVVGE
jgi:hypothetical protein